MSSGAGTSSELSRSRRSASGAEEEGDCQRSWKAKRGRKRKICVPEVDSPEPAAKMARLTEPPEPARVSEDVDEMHNADHVPLPEPQRAPVARMW